MNADQPLLGELRDLFAADPVPPEVLAAARDSYGWRSLDAQIAALVADSMLASASVRGSSDRLLSFDVDDTTIAIQVTAIGNHLRIVGHLTPSAPARVRVDQPRGAVEVLADRFGRFAIEELPPGPTRFICVPEADDAPTIQTDWTVL